MRGLAPFVLATVLTGAACTGADVGPSGDPAGRSISTESADSAATASGDTTSRPAAQAAGGDELLGPSRVVDGLENVENSTFALGSVWAVTSNLPDEFSPGEIQADVVRIDPTSGRAEQVLASPGLEPSLAEVGGRLWVKLVDRVVALDSRGAEVDSIPMDLGRSDDLTSEGGLLWLVLNDADQVLGIEPATADIVYTIATGDFPVSPTSAFGFVWIPNLIDGTITIIDTTADTDVRVLTEFVTEGPRFVMPVADGAGGNEMWVTNTAGEVFAVSARQDTLGQVRRVAVDRSINRVVAHGERAFLLPTWGRSVLVLDLRTDAVLAEIPIDSIPVRAVSAHGLIWVTGDGGQEALTVIDPVLLAVKGRFQVGSGASNTTGPQQPLQVGDEIWVPNRGDDAFFIVGIDRL